MFLGRYLMPAGVAFPLFMAYIINVVTQIRHLKYIYILLPLFFVVTVDFNPEPNIRTDKMVELVKTQRANEGTLTLVQPHWTMFSFSYYYDRNIFKQYDEKDAYANIDAELNKQNIYGVNVTSDSVFTTINNYKKIVFIDADHGTVFPGNHIQNLLGSKYKLISQNPDSLGFGYYIYINPINGHQ